MPLGNLAAGFLATSLTAPRVLVLDGLVLVLVGTAMRVGPALRVGVASHNLFDVAYGLLLRAEAGEPVLEGPSLVEAVFRCALWRWFGVLFWFLLLGPAGALLYRLVSLSAQGEARRTLPPAQSEAAAASG